MHTFLSDCYSISTPVFLKSRGKDAFQPYLAEERQRISLEEMLACLQEKCLSGDRIYPGWTDVTGEGALSVHISLDTGTGSLKELQYPDFVCVCVFPPFRYEFVSFRYFPVSCGAVLPQEHEHSTITLALADLLLLFLTFSVPTSKTDMLTMCCSLAHLLQVGRVGRYQLQGRLATVHSESCCC